MKYIKPFTYNYKKIGNEEYTFTNKHGTVYNVTFSDGLFQYSTVKYGFSYTNEKDSINVMNTLIEIIVDFLSTDEYGEVYSDNLHSGREIKKIKSDNIDTKEPPINIGRRVKNNRTRFLEKYLKTLPSEFGFEVDPFAGNEDNNGNVNLIKIYRK